jgi:anti-sigma28 factor (negative regulator of flagellin synthesis)
MGPKRSVWLPTMLASAALLAGCGSSSSSSTTTSTTTSTPAASAQTTSTSSTPTTATGAAPSTQASSKAIGRLAASICSAEGGQASLPAAMKAKVEEICHDATSGHQAQAEAIARKVCVETIESIPGPKTAAREKALKECTTE